MYIKFLAFLLGFLITLLIINYLTVEKLKLETFETPVSDSLFNANIATTSTSSITAPTIDNPTAIASGTTPTATTGTTSTATNGTTSTTASGTTPTASGTTPTVQSTIIPSNTNVDLLDAKTIPYKSYKYMCINTFTDIKKISNQERRWYESDLEKIIGIEDNKYHYFTFNNNITLVSNDINKNGSVGANIYTIELNGPKSFNFANNLNTNEVYEFSVIISAKIKDIINKNNIIFEMTGNTETISDKELQYSPSLVNINLMKNINNNFDIIITIGNVIYKGLINNIDKNNIINNDLIVICLIYTASDITLYLNKLKFTYKNTENFKVKLGSTPIIINKGGFINMDLYNFIYYKYPIPVNEINKLTKYSYYYLSGLDFTISNTNKCETSQDQQVKLIDNKIKELEANYIKSLEQKTKQVNNDINNNLNIKPLSYDNDKYLLIKKDINHNKKSFLDWLF